MDHMREGIFVAEGEKLVRRLLATNLSIVSMLVTPEWYEKLFGTSTPPSSRGIFDVLVAEKQLLQTIVGYNMHQGIMAVGRIPEEQQLSEVIQKLTRPSLFVALDGLASSENVGVVVRNAAAFGASGILVGERSSSPYLRRAVRNSMGAIFQLPVFHVHNLAEELRTLQQQNVRIIAAHPGGEATIHTAPMEGSICIVMGNEDGGVSPEILSLCDDRISIPMSNNTDSLNVSSASAVFLYEVTRRRRQ
jgi:tRNA G18 (ribose-2'-O)-methylase SpoU